MSQYPTIKVNAAQYHRNGISGIGFYAVRFTFIDDEAKTRSAIATIFNNDSDDAKVTGHCAVLVENSQGHIDISDKYRGDHFEAELRKFLVSEAGINMCWPTLYTLGKK